LVGFLVKLLCGLKMEWNNVGDDPGFWLRSCMLRTCRLLHQYPESESNVFQPEGWFSFEFLRAARALGEQTQPVAIPQSTLIRSPRLPLGLEPPPGCPDFAIRAEGDPVRRRRTAPKRIRTASPEEANKRQRESQAGTTAHAVVARAYSL
jgi:hypothetical protein